MFYGKESVCLPFSIFFAFCVALAEKVLISALFAKSDHPIQKT